MTFQWGKRLPMLLFCQWEAHSLGSEDVSAPIFCWWCCTWCSCSSGPGRTCFFGGIIRKKNILVSFETFGGLWFDLPPARTASSLHPVLRGRTPRCTLKTMLKLWRFPFRIIIRRYLHSVQSVGLAKTQDEVLDNWFVELTQSTQVQNLEVIFWHHYQQCVMT